VTERIARGTVVMALDRCKGCGLCVPVCRPGVLEMTDARNEKGYILPQLLDGCTGCRACAEVCPDFVFEVYRFGPFDPHELDDELDPEEFQQVAP
jgi:2-oxoglutarate ferredoxin oxidoreductase subunit delta